MIPSNLRKLAVIVVSLVAVAACAMSSPWKQEQADAHVNIGVAYLGTDRFNDALKEFLLAQDFTPRDPRVHFYLGITFNGKGQKDQAIKEFNEAVSLRPDYSEAHNFLGAVYLGMGEWDKAIDACKKALANVTYETPDKALFNMGRAYYGRGDYGMALDAYAEAKNRKPNTIPLPLLDHHMGMSTYAQGNFPQASQHFRKALEQAPSFLESRYWLGHCYLKMRDWDRAGEEFKAVIKETPGSELGANAGKSLDAVDTLRNKP